MYVYVCIYFFIGILSVEIVLILNLKVVCGLDIIFDCIVFGYFFFDVVKWKYSFDGKLFIDFDIDMDKYL